MTSYFRSFFLSERMHFPLCLCSLLVTVNFCYKRTLNALSLPPAVSHNTRSLTGQKRNLGWCVRARSRVNRHIYVRISELNGRYDLQPHLQCSLCFKQRGYLFIRFYLLPAIARDLRWHATQGQKVLAVPFCVPGLCMERQRYFQNVTWHVSAPPTPLMFGFYYLCWPKPRLRLFYLSGILFYFFGILPLNRERA